MLSVTTRWPRVWRAGLSVVITRKPPVYVISEPYLVRSRPVTYRTNDGATTWFSGMNMCLGGERSSANALAASAAVILPSRIMASRTVFWLCFAEVQLTRGLYRVGRRRLLAGIAACARSRDSV